MKGEGGSVGNARGFGKETVPRRGHIRLVISAVMLVALTACGQSEGSLRQGDGAGDAAWSGHIRKVHDALAKNDVSGRRARQKPGQCGAAPQ